ncbi:STAS domain-containing protein [Streptomyces sp. NPDC006655]|uniref:STAS domain-containing protein n=1 Tax=Streptomyces sp. NPDC006655 TaxID=3156898 RepID=UPI003454C7C7
MSSANGGESRPDPTTPHAASVPYLTQREQAGARAVAVHGAFDASSALLLASALQDAAATRTTLVVDAAGMTFAGSTVLNVLLNFHRNHRLRLARPARQFLRVLELTGAGNAFPGDRGGRRRRVNRRPCRAAGQTVVAV